METNAYIGEIIASLVYLVVGLRLFALSRRTRGTPETLLALSFLAWTSAFAFYNIPYAFVEDEERIAPFFSYGSLTCLGVGNVVFAVFIRSTFRGRERWAGALLAVICLSAVVGLIGTGWVGDWEGEGVFTNPFYWSEFVGSFAPSVWMAVEGFVHHFKARRRFALGLCDAMMCHRFLLWGIAGALWIFLELVIAAQDHAYSIFGRPSTWLGIGNALLEMAPIAIVWLVFFPPRAYRRWVERAAPAAPA
ncbi:MAG TPA: hypothetical protein VEC18_01245 [Myxococcota bacterium]|nr:hypothetical protein [Myxococcota bacterium]